MKNTKAQMSGIVIQNSWGRFYLEASDKGLYRLSFFRSSREAKRRETSKQPQKVLLSKARLLLKRYFAGRPVSFTKLPIDDSGFTAFEKKVFRQLSKIRYGKVQSYAGLAQSSGSPKAARAVGGTMRKNRLPIILPCHRIIGSQGRLGGYSLGLGWKRSFCGWKGWRGRLKKVLGRKG